MLAAAKHETVDTLKAGAARLALYTLTGRKDQAIQLLIDQQRQAPQGDLVSRYLQFQSCPRYASLRTDPRFAALLMVEKQKYERLRASYRKW